MERPEIKHCFSELIYFPEIFIMLSFRSSGIAYRSAEEGFFSCDFGINTRTKNQNKLNLKEETEKTSRQKCSL